MKLAWTQTSSKKFWVSEMPELERRKPEEKPSRLDLCNSWLRASVADYLQKRVKSGSSKKSASPSWTQQVSVPASSHQQPCVGATRCPTRTYGTAVAFSGQMFVPCMPRLSRPCTPLLFMRLEGSRSCIGAEGRESGLDQTSAWAV